MSLISQITKSTIRTAAKAAANITEQTGSKAAKELFCHQYWKDAAAERVIRATRKESVSLHGYLNGINHHFINSPYPQHMDMKFVENMTPREMITTTDFEFKSLKPTTEKITAFRCIGEKPEFFSEYKLYQKRLGIKKGDIVDMKEYAYATSDMSYAKGYLTNNKGILYEIEIPEQSQVSRTGLGIKNEIVFPRSSKFECVDVKKVKDTDNDYLHVKLRYIKPKNYIDTST